jgi:hypothetical protein
MVQLQIKNTKCYIHIMNHTVSSSYRVYKKTIDTGVLYIIWVNSENVSSFLRHLCLSESCVYIFVLLPMSPRFTYNIRDRFRFCSFMCFTIYFADISGSRLLMVVISWETFCYDRVPQLKPSRHKSNKDLPIKGQNDQP